MGQKKVNELKVGSIITYINLIISTIIPLLYTPIMLRILGQEEYGLYSLSNSVISYLTLLNFGFGTAIIRFISKFRIEGDHDKIEGVTGLILSIYGIIAIIVCIVGFLLTKGTGLFFGTGLTVNEIQRLKILMVIMTVSTAISFPKTAPIRTLSVAQYSISIIELAKTYIENRDSNGNVIRTQYISNSVYKNKNN